MSEIRRLLGEEMYQECFAKKETGTKIGDKRSSSPINETEKKKLMPDQVENCCNANQSFSDQEETRSELKKADTNYKCKHCGKLFSRFDGLHRHKTYHCKAAQTSILKLEWTGDTWVKSEGRLYNRLQIGRNLCNLIEKDALKEDVLNGTQREYVNMYRSLFSE